MKNLLFCRRTFIAALSVVGIIVVGCYTRDVSACYALAGVSSALSAANSYEGSKKPKG